MLNNVSKERLFSISSLALQAVLCQAVYQKPCKGAAFLIVVNSVAALGDLTPSAPKIIAHGF